MSESATATTMECQIQVNSDEYFHNFRVWVIFKKLGCFTVRQKLTYNNFFCVICQVVSWILGCTVVVMILTASFSAMNLQTTNARPSWKCMYKGDTIYQLIK